MSIKVIDNTIKVQEGLASAIKRGLEAIGATAEGYAKDSLTASGAVDTGLLRNSVTWALSGGKTNISSYKANRGDGHGEYSGNAPNDKDMAVYIGTNVNYADKIEFGTRKMPPRPYLKPAATEHTPEYRELMKQSLENA